MFHNVPIIGHNIARKLGKHTMFGDKKLVGGLEHDFMTFHSVGNVMIPTD